MHGRKRKGLFIAGGGTVDAFGAHLLLRQLQKLLLRSTDTRQTVPVSGARWVMLASNLRGGREWWGGHSSCRL
jgi:hypothetical protein